MATKFYYKDVKFRLRRTREIKKWIEEVIRAEGKMPGDLSFIILGNEDMLEINREFLAHDYYTDVIAFDYGNGNEVTGEIYLGIETIRKNAKQYNKALIGELMRVIIHGVLHITGYDDREEKDKRVMREKEDYYLERFRGG